MRTVRQFAPRALIAAFVLALLAYGAISYRVADGVTKLERKPLEPAAAAVSSVHEDVSFTATDGLLLKGWWFPTGAVAGGPGAQAAKPDKAVDKIAPLFLARGWDVLLFDLRGHGESAGDRYSLGQYEPRDIVGAIDFVHERTGIDRRRIAVIGESLGGGSAIMTVAADPTIGPVVTDSAYSDGYTVVAEVGQNYTGLPSWFTPGIVLTSKYFFGLDVLKVKPYEVVGTHPERAWLFIECDADKTVFPHHGTDLRTASANPDTELWMVRGCDHVQAFTKHPEEWARYVFAFLDREIAKVPPAASR